MPLPEILQYRTLALARLGKADEARESLANYLQQKTPKSFGTYMEIQLPAWLGDNAEAMDKSPEQSKQFADRAIEILGELISGGYSEKQQLLEDPDFANLHKDVRFASLLGEMGRIPEFWVADREVSRGQFEMFMSDASYAAKEKPEKWEGVDKGTSPTADHPAQRVSWYDSVMYCNWLSLHEGRKPCYERTGTKEKEKFGNAEYDAWRLIPGSNGYRLLRESEWEYACRAGTATGYSMGNDESLLVSYCQMYPSKLTSFCGAKLPNGWGLHDVHGNVVEWCEDLDDANGSYRVYRGGSWNFDAGYCRSADRSGDDPSPRGSYNGFRLALSPSVKQPEAVHDK